MLSHLHKLSIHRRPLPPLKAPATVDATLTAANLRIHWPPVLMPKSFAGLLRCTTTPQLKLLRQQCVFLPSAAEEACFGLGPVIKLETGILGIVRSKNAVVQVVKDKGH